MNKHRSFLVGLILALVVATVGWTVMKKRFCGAWITYRRTGGFAGVNDTVTVSSKGEVQISDRQGVTATSQLPSDELAQLRSLLSEADLPSLDREYSNPGEADVFGYQLQSGGVTVSWTQTTTPPKLLPLQNALDRLLQHEQLSQ